MGVPMGRAPQSRILVLMALAALAACGGGGSSAPPPPSTPALSGLSPSHGSPGTTIQLTGSNLGGAGAVAFNGHAAFSFTVASASQIQAVVPGDATTGPIQVTTPTGTATSATFTVDPAQAPVVSGFGPIVLSPGTVVNLLGSHFVGATRVRFNGLDAATFTVVSDTEIHATAPAGLTPGALSVTGPGGTGEFPFPYSTANAAQVLLNTGFEQAVPLAWQGDTGVIQPAPGASAADIVPHTGTRFAWLGGYGQVASDQVAQDLYVPASAQSATATFYLKILTAETGPAAADTCTVAALDTSGATLGVLKTLSNLDASDYRAYSVDLLPYKGQTVRLSFRSQEDGSRATSFLLDDVSVDLQVPSGPDLNPVITQFTPSSGVPGEAIVQVTGGNFFDVWSVTLGGANASFTVIDGTRLAATVPAGAPFGSAPITIANSRGTGSSDTPFTIAYGQATVTGVNPGQGPVGTPVVISGTYLGYAGTTLRLNGLPIQPSALTPTQILFTVPPGASSGDLVITTPSGAITRTFTVNTASTTLDLRVAKVELTQSTQTLDNTVPIVAGKAGLVRVFVLANQANTATPAVRITLLNGGSPVPGYPKTVPAPGTSVPGAVDESTLSGSWNLAIPDTDLTTSSGGYSVEATVDPGGLLAEADKSNNTTTVALAAATVPVFRTTLFPVILASGTGNITEANKAAWVARLARMYPIAAVDVSVGAPFTPSVSTLGNDGTGWDILLNDLTTKHVADGASDRYYYGALDVSYASGVAGLGWVPQASTADFRYRTAIGWDKTGYADGGNFPEVFAHETGHNMGRQHSPCGGAANPDPAYPYANALIGVWGYDSILNQLKAPSTTKDIMGYCSPVWISDYVYRKVLDFRGGTGGFLKVGAEDSGIPAAQARPRECLIVRGIVDAKGGVRLLPAFRTQALPSALPASGAYTLACADAQGRPVASTPIELMDLGCWPGDPERQFVMALALDGAQLDAIAQVNVLRDGRILASQRSAGTPARSLSAPPEFLRPAPGLLQLTWDATLHPAALVRDLETGDVVAILSGGRQTLPSRGRRFEVVLSDGLASERHRLEAPE